MSALLKYVIFPSSLLATGMYGYGSLNDGTVRSFNDAIFQSVYREISSLEPARQETAFGRVDPGAAASVDEELDYLSARRLDSVAGWQAFLATHGSGVNAQTARSELEKLTVAEKASTSATDEASAGAGAIADANAAIPPSLSPATQATALTPDDVCKRDEDRLARLRSSPSGYEVARFVAELKCGRLWPQLSSFIDQLDLTPTGHAGAAKNGSSAGAQSTSETTSSPPSDSGTDGAVLGASIPASQPNGPPATNEDTSATSPVLRPSAAVRSAALSPAQEATQSPHADATAANEATPSSSATSGTDGAALVASAPPTEAIGPPATTKSANGVVRSAPLSPGTQVAAPSTAAEANAKAANEVVASSPPSVSGTDGGALTDSAPIPETTGSLANGGATNGAVPSASSSPGSQAAATSSDAEGTQSLHADEKTAIDPRPSSPETQVAFALDDICKRDVDRLERLRSNPSGEEARRFASELGCERLRPQLRRLMESLGYTAPAPEAATLSTPSSSVPQANAGDDCAIELDALDRVRAQPTPEAAQHLWRDLHCERLRPQVRLLLESLDVAADPSGSCRQEVDELNRIRENPDQKEAERFVRNLTCNDLKPQAARLLESLAQ